MNNVNALETIKDNYLKFSEYTMRFRTYPSVFDGMKIAQRRVLWSAYSKVPTKMVKLSTLSGAAQSVHPHAEATDVIINMGGEHKTTFPLFDTHGNFGDNFGNPASAPRYLECRLNDTARKLYFSLIDKAPFDNFEVEEEPIYLPTLFPLAFLQGCFSVGQGTPNPLIPDLQFEDLKKYVINYIKTGQKEVTKNNFVRFVDYDKIRNDKNKDQSIIDVLNNGKGSVYYQPTVTLSKDKTTITISNLYILASFESLISYLKDDIQADKIDVIDESTEERIWIIEKVKNKVYDMEELAKKLKSKYTYKENYTMYFHNEEGKVRPYSLGEVIEECYKKYREAYVSKLNSNIDVLCEQKMILSCLSLMSDHTDIVTDNKLSDEEKIKVIKEAINSEYNEYIIKKCLEKPIRFLKKDDKAIHKIENEISDLQNNINDINNVVISDIENIYKRRLSIYEK